MGWIEFWCLQIALWAGGYVFAKPFYKREKFCLKFGLFIAGIFFFSLGFQFFLWHDQRWMEILLRLIVCVLMTLYIYLCWEVSLTMAVYNTIWAIGVWQMIEEIWMIFYNMNTKLFDAKPVLIIVSMFVLYGVVYFLLTKTGIKWMHENQKKTIGPRQMISAVLIFLIIMVLSFSPVLRHVGVYSTEWKFLFLSQFLCFVILYLQNEMFKKSRMREEMAIMNLLRKKEQEQYELAKESIALINQKTHDLKHQIRALRRASKEEINRYLDEMEESVKIYEAIVKTGNEVLDTVLTEKSLYCKDREIQVSCVADGCQMDFISTMDLYAILGNAIDNAIEAVEKFQEKEKRQIDVMVYRQQNFLVINIINPIPEALVYEGGMPITTKGDKNYHGYGLRSIKHTVKKYDGCLNISEEDGCFSLKILIPVPITT